MRVAIIHDWLNGMRGGEKVLEALLEVFPDAPIFTLFHEAGTLSAAIENRRIVTSWLDRIPGVYKHYRNLLPLFPAAITSLDLSGFDLIVSSSHAVAKGVDPRGAFHICYCHTPMRYIWDAAADYEMTGLRRAVFDRVRPHLQRWDKRTAGTVDAFIANSRFVAARIARYYSRTADVIYPPIDTRYFTADTERTRNDFYLAAGALAPYKRVDRIIRAFNQNGRKLIVAGGGPLLRELRALAASNVDVRGWISNEELRNFYRTAKALVYMGREDFGMVAAEAQACGCPVIAFGEGGLTEIVIDGINGVLFPVQDEAYLTRAVEQFELKPWPLDRVKGKVERFSRESFRAEIQAFVEKHTAEKSPCADARKPA